MPPAPSPASSSELLVLTADGVKHFGDVRFVQLCVRAHVPAWQPRADASELSRQTRRNATLQDREHAPMRVSVHRK